MNNPFEAAETIIRVIEAPPTERMGLEIPTGPPVGTVREPALRLTG